jgi:glycosyltransferase involved in cell wall biosynthesis
MPIIRSMAMEEPYLCSALVSTYNSERFLRGCLEDLAAQTLGGRLEIIVIDSGSQQNERGIVEAFQKRLPNLVYLRTDQRENLYAAWNRGVRMARGRYITNTNTDDRRLPHALEMEARALDRFPDAGLVYADVWATAIENDTLTPGDTGRFKRCSYPDFTLLNGLAGSNFSPQPMWRKAAHDPVGFFDDTYPVAGDYEFFFRLARSLGALHIRAPLGLYLENPGGIQISQPKRTAAEFSRLRRKFYSEIALEEFFPSLAGLHSDARARGSALFELGNNCLLATMAPEYELAAARYAQAVPLLGAIPQLLHNLAIARIGLGESKEGLKLLTKAGQSLPASAALAEALSRSGGSLAALAPGALQIFSSAHPVVKAAREGRGIGLETLGPLP